MKALQPTHYKAGKNDVIDFCNHHAINFNRGNVIKYVTRAGRKSAKTELEDLQKALEYLKREIAFIEESNALNESCDEKLF